MALNLNEYIKMSYERPNREVLEGLGASENLIEYLMETPGNTNWNVIDSIGGSTVTITYKIYSGESEHGVIYTKTINAGEPAPIPVGLIYCLMGDNDELFFIENGIREDLPEISGNWWCITLAESGFFEDFDYYYPEAESASSPEDMEISDLTWGDYTIGTDSIYENATFETDLSIQFMVVSL